MDWREENKLKQKAQEYYEKELSYNQVYIQGYSDGYNKAIDEFAEHMKEDTMARTFGLRCYDIDKIAEQMKAGGKNES